MLGLESWTAAVKKTLKSRCAFEAPAGEFHNDAVERISEVIRVRLSGFERDVKRPVAVGRRLSNH